MCAIAEHIQLRALWLTAHIDEKWQAALLKCTADARYILRSPLAFDTVVQTYGCNTVTFL